MQNQLTQLKNILYEVADLNAAGAILSWDQTVYMPPAGAAGRGRALSTLSRLAHEKFTAPEVGRLLDELEPWAVQEPEDSDEAALVRVTRRNYDKLTKVPATLIAAFNAHSSEAWGAWAKARPVSDFAAVQPYLEKTLDFSRQLANCFPGYAHIADPLIDNSDYGMKAASVRAIFAQLREQLVPLVRAITAQPPADDTCLNQHYPEAQQKAFGEQVIKQLGYDFSRGRQDKTAHPYMTRFNTGDVRITTRFKENDFADGFFSTVHECGHALYELGVNPAYDGLPLGGGTSAGVHESQSRLWENIVGRSRGFWQHFYPQLQAAFPAQLGQVEMETFYRAINTVQRSLIRTDADEITYNLHVILRFDIELALLEGTLAVKDLPAEWHARYEADLGLHAPNDTDGCLQDMHWFIGTIGGMFQGYTLGNIMSGQIYAAALKANPEIPAQIARGEFAPLHTWLKENVYWSGSKYTAPELLERVTGQAMTIAPYIAYLRQKYGTLYQL